MKLTIYLKSKGSEKALELIESGLDKIKISIDARTKEIRECHIHADLEDIPICRNCSKARL